MKIKEGKDKLLSKKISISSNRIPEEVKKIFEKGSLNENMEELNNLSEEIKKELFLVMFRLEEKEEMANLLRGGENKLSKVTIYSSKEKLKEDIRGMKIKLNKNKLVFEVMNNNGLISNSEIKIEKQEGKYYLTTKQNYFTQYLEISKTNIVKEELQGLEEEIDNYLKNYGTNNDNSGITTPPVVNLNSKK